MLPADTAPYLDLHEPTPAAAPMNWILPMIGSFIGGWIGWYAGAWISFGMGLLGSLIGTGLGIYAGKRVLQDYF